MTKTFAMMLAGLLALGLSACGGSEATEVETGKAQEEKEASKDAQELSFNADNSSVEWTGYKFSGSKHDGGFNTIDGKAWVKDGKLEKVEVNIDIASMWTDDDDKSPDEDKLKGHLLNEDFFEVETYPSARFVSTSIEEGGEGDATHTITGNLTMKDQTKSIKIPAKVTISDGSLTATSSFQVDRTAFNIEYGSTSLGIAKDKAIQDNVELRLNINAK